MSLSPSIRVTFSEPVDASTVSTSSLSLTSTTPVPGRVVLGAGNRSASFLPDGNLEPLTSYTLTANPDILDTSGNPLLPFTSSFRTLDDSIPELNPDALTESFPDGNGVVTVEAPEFSFEANAAVTIVNLTNGIVVTGNVNPDGSFLFQIQASITDELQIRILDSSNREVVIEKTEFHGPNGEVAIGRKGGKVTSGEFVLEVPEGALTGASVFTLTPVDQAVIDALPLADGAGGLGSAVEVNVGGAALREEADLSFPVPSAAPPNAGFAVVRKVEEEGVVLYEVIDTATVVDGKLRTESPPFLGVLVTGFYMPLWYPPHPTTGKNPMGAITGIAREIDTSPVNPEENPLSGVKVRVDETLQAGNYTATTDRDGRFVLLDAFFGAVGPTLNLLATDSGTPPRQARAVAFEDQQVISRFLTLTRFSRAGEVVFNFPLSPPPPPPTEVTIFLFRKNGDARIAITNGFAAVGDELIVKVQFTQPPEFVNVAVNGQNVAVSRREDERVSVNGEDRTAFVFEGTFTPQEARSYTIVAEARDAFLNLLTARKSFLAAQGGAGNEERLEGPPAIISDSAVPRNGDTGVPVTQVMSVQFTEPVTNASGATVTFEELGETPGTIPLDLIGTKVGGAVAPVVATDEVVALTLTPQRGLKFATKYRLTFSTAIVDTDLSPTGQPDRKPLSSETNVIESETFRPTKLGEAPLEGSLVAMTTLENLAFVAFQRPDANGFTGNLQVFDLSDPTQPTKVGEDSLFIGSMVRDVEVEKDVELEGGDADIVGVLSFNPRSGNSGLTLFDVTSRQSPFPYAGFVTTVVPGEGADSQVDLHE
ncbi:MAG: Ig-like domain-containing protein, partial [Thermoplasmata archaeon]